jgi:hypothetical protein
MHPRDLQNQALVAAGNAQREGFTATAEAFKLMAIICAEEARELVLSPAFDIRRTAPHSTSSHLHLLETAL